MVTHPEPYPSDEEAQRDWNRALQLVDDGKDEDARAIFLRLWEDGYPDAARELGEIEERKGASQQHLSDAEDWYSRALDALGNDAAKLNWARIIIRRRALDKVSVPDGRLDLARSFLEELSERRVPQAAVFLASHLLSGYVFPVDFERGEALLRIGAEHEYITAFTMLRWLHFQKGNYCSALKFWGLSVIKTISIIRHNPRDERLFGLIKR